MRHFMQQTGNGGGIIQAATDADELPPAVATSGLPEPSYVVHASDVVGRQPATPVPLIEIKEESTELLAIKH
jgi:hypothetical protein